jgi:hypothetical protein
MFIINQDQTISSTLYKDLVWGVNHDQDTGLILVEKDSKYKLVFDAFNSSVSSVTKTISAI